MPPVAVAKAAPDMADGHAQGPVEATITPGALLVAEADLGERIVRALILPSGPAGP